MSRPRTRGDYPVVEKRPVRGVASTPHTRGLPLTRAISPDGAMVDPAHAGITPATGSNPLATICRPRTRGDYPVVFPAALIAVMSTPHTRGLPVSGRRKIRKHRVDPAHAGITLVFVKVAQTADGRPRTRGDYPALCPQRKMMRKSTPHTRGLPGGFFGAYRGDGVDPAHAGITPPHLRHEVGGDRVDPAHAGITRRTTRL